MDQQHPLYTDPFNLESQTDPATTPFTLQPPNSTPSAAQNTPASRPTPSLTPSSAAQAAFVTLSPSPSTPAQQAFNPDDFFASPPQETDGPLVQDRFTPELKRRLFGPADPLQSAPNTATRKSAATSSSLGITTPIPHATFANPLSSSGTEDCNSLNISPAQSPTRNLLPEVVAAAAQQVDPARVELPKPAVVTQTLSALPGTPFTPATAQKAKCSCKASKCLKLYCPCFANSGFCGGECTCKNCQNSRGTAFAVLEARETVLARDPRAFEPKVRNSPATASGGDIHTKGCNCRKGCGKNYCVCRELRVDCGPRCTCSGPNGCLNGKTDALEDHHFKDKADHILGAGRKARLSPGRLRGGLLPTKSSRAKTSGPKQERKRQKKEPQSRAGDDAKNGDVADVLSPSFPSFKIDFPPSLDLRDGMDELGKVIGDGDDFITPFSLRKDGQVLTFREPGQGGAVGLQPRKGGDQSGTQETFLGAIDLHSGLNRNLSGHSDEGPPKTLALSNEDVINLKRRITDFDSRHRTDGEREAQIDGASSVGEQDSSKVKTAPLKRERELASNVEGTQVIPSDKSRTPERARKVPDIEAASSPATGAKDASSRGWGSLRGSLFGKEDKIEVCRLPRILRVKMGSGRLLRKFDV